ncbi:hypothetical protein VKI21_02125 [Cyanobacterium aponinum UTEX 3222]|nr:hypothetical protein VKI21_02125 [Cyanobacterium aponinum UTEX 3222]
MNKPKHKTSTPAIPQWDEQDQRNLERLDELKKQLLRIKAKYQ